MSYKVCRSDFIIGTGNGSMLPSGAQGGFFWLPIVNGHPGTPSNLSDIAPVCIDGTDKLIKFYDVGSAAWLSGLIGPQGEKGDQGPAGDGVNLWYNPGPSDFDGNMLQPKGLGDSVVIGDISGDSAWSSGSPHLEVSGIIYGDDYIRAKTGFAVGEKNVSLTPGLTQDVTISGTTLHFTGGILTSVT